MDFLYICIGFVYTCMGFVYIFSKTNTSIVLILVFKGNEKEDDARCKTQAQFIAPPPPRARVLHKLKGFNLKVFEILVGA